MGTRGAYGFKYKDVKKVTYSHYDSYPSRLGVNVLNFIKENSINQLKAIFDSIVLISDTESKPTDKQIEECRMWADDNIFQKKNKGCIDWYWLLCTAQGSLSCYAQGLKYMTDDSKFLADSLFCEWAYIINLDTEILDIYKNGYTVRKIPLVEIQKNFNQVEKILLDLEE
ncbi:MAG: hypothetical protein RSC93_02730 [Erysipelotrichaceae bacterium]